VTFIIGRFDDLVPSDRVTWAERHFEVRILDCDHFIIFREPGFVADVVIEKLDDARRSSLPFVWSRSYRGVSAVKVTRVTVSDRQAPPEPAPYGTQLARPAGQAGRSLTAA
jgi:hypothetical protein